MIARMTLKKNLSTLALVINNILNVWFQLRSRIHLFIHGRKYSSMPWGNYTCLDILILNNLGV